MGWRRLDSVKAEIISAQGVEHRYGKINALQVDSITVTENDLTAIVGPNGGGKSTLLKALAGIIKPFKGKVTRRSSCSYAYLPQNTQIDRTFPMRVEDVVAMGLWHQIRSFGRVSAAAKQQIYNSLKMVGLEGFEHRSLYELSGGQLQRMLFARLAIQDADVMFLDEPFAAVDAKTTRELLKLIKRWHSSGKTIVVVSHNIPLVQEHFPKTLLLAKQVYGYGATDEVLTQKNLNAIAFEALCASGTEHSTADIPTNNILGGNSDL